MHKIRPREGVNALLLLLGGLIAHYVAGGSFINPQQFLISVALSFALLLSFGSKKLEGPKLAMLVLITQSLGHFILGGNSQNNVIMALSHIIAGVCTYFCISQAEVFWNKTSEILLELFLPNHLHRFSFNNSSMFSTGISGWIFNPFLGFVSMWMRGPPQLFESMRFIFESKGNLCQHI